MVPDGSGEDGDPHAGLRVWLLEHASTGPVERIEQLVGGNSNATYQVVAQGGRFIVRRPPLHAMSASAHSMDREHRVLCALAGTDVPVPAALAICTDPTVFGAPFVVMSEVLGVPLSDHLPETYGPDAVTRLGHQMVDALASLHGVDWEAAGLTGFGRPSGFLERQVTRWRSQFQSYAVRDLPVFEAVAGWLEQNLPAAPQRPGLLHGDFHLDNCLWSTEAPELMAVIDWELSTIGDPLVDLGLCLALWGHRPVPVPALARIQAVSRVPGAPSVEELAERYAQRAGRPVTHLPFYRVLALWKLAAILEGAYAQHVGGQLDSEYARSLRADVPTLLDEAAAHAGVAAL